MTNGRKLIYIFYFHSVRVSRVVLIIEYQAFKNYILCNKYFQVRTLDTHPQNSSIRQCNTTCYMKKSNRASITNWWSLLLSSSSQRRKNKWKKSCWLLEQIRTTRNLSKFQAVEEKNEIERIFSSARIEIIISK
jgi:hypothetical protein